MQEFKKKEIYNEYLISIEKEKKNYDHPGPQGQRDTTVNFF